MILWVYDSVILWFYDAEDAEELLQTKSEPKCVAYSYPTTAEIPSWLSQSHDGTSHDGKG